MLRSIVFFSCISFILISCSGEKKYNPSKLLTNDQKDSVLMNLIILTDEHRPDTITLTNRTEPKNRPFFTSIVNKYTFDYLYKDEDGTYYYFIHKLGRGVDDLYVGIGGTFRVGPQNELLDFEESFRMWRMLHKELQLKGREVYENFIQHKSLAVYMNNEQKHYIEFPNNYVVYDKIHQDWKVIKLR